METNNTKLKDLKPFNTQEELREFIKTVVLSHKQTDKLSVNAIKIECLNIGEEKNLFNIQDMKLSQRHFVDVIEEVLNDMVADNLVTISLSDNRRYNTYSPVKKKTSTKKSASKKEEEKVEENQKKTDEKQTKAPVKKSTKTKTGAKKKTTKSVDRDDTTKSEHVAEVSVPKLSEIVKEIESQVSPTNSKTPVWKNIKNITVDKSASKKSTKDTPDFVVTESKDDKEDTKKSSSTHERKLRNPKPKTHIPLSRQAKEPNKPIRRFSRKNDGSTTIIGSEIENDPVVKNLTKNEKPKTPSVDSKKVEEISKPQETNTSSQAYQQKDGFLSISVDPIKLDKVDPIKVVKSNNEPSDKQVTSIPGTDMQDNQELNKLPDGQYVVNVNTGEVLGTVDEFFGEHPNDQEQIQPVQTQEQNVPTEIPKYVMGLGDRECYLYYDVKLTSNSRSSTIISLAIIDCDGRYFYGEVSDIQFSQCSENVLLHVLPELRHPENVETDDNIVVYGSFLDVQVAFGKWYRAISTKHHPNKNFQFLGDHVDITFLPLVEFMVNSTIDPLSRVPDRISKTALNLNQELAASASKVINEGQDPEEVYKNYVPAKDLYNVSRFKLASQFVQFTNFLNEFPGYHANNALIDAFAVRILHQNLWGVLGER